MKMMAEIEDLQEPKQINPKKFAMWLFIIAAIMFFAGLTSAYIVRMREGNWYEFTLPVQFLYSTITILASSFTMWWAYRAAKNDEIKQIQVGLILTFLLGVGFCILQVLGWQEMTANNLFFADDVHGDRVSASFIYALSGLHLLHLAGGIIFLFVLIIKSLRLDIHRKKLLSVNICNTYWHFVGILWIYLYLFFYFAH